MGEAGGLGSLLFTGDWIALGILTVLVVMSVYSWAVILLKWIQLRKVRFENAYFQDSFKRKSTLREIADIAHRLHVSPLARMYEGSYRELNAFRSSVEKAAGAGAAPARERERLPAGPDYRERLLDHLGRAQERVYNDQAALLERRLPLLATISASAPFIGLFGTVLGIIEAFRNIGMSGVTSLAVVAPGISEALVATAAGLLAAIPALIGYNVYRNHIREVSTQMKNFALEITNRLDRVL